jgi:dihydropteroate synthase
MVNDVCGFADPEMARVCRERDVAVVKMASPPDLERPGAVEDVDDIYAALERGGLTEKTVVDPAFGGWSEAKTLADDRETFRRLREFRGLDRPILVSINRKNFLRDLAGRSTEEALPVSLAATSMAVERGAHVVRTHDVAETRDAAVVGDAFARERLRAGGDVAVEELDVTTRREAARHVARLGDCEGAVDAAVARAFELTGLDGPARGAVRAAATDTGVAVVDGGGRALLFGTPAGFAAFVPAAAGASDALDAALSRIERSLQQEENL